MTRAIDTAADGSDAEVRRWRGISVGLAVVLAALIGAFLVVQGSDDENERSADPTTELIATGEAAYERKQYSLARRSFLSAIARDPDSAAAHYNLGLIMQLVDQNPAGAEAQYRKAIDAQPDFTSALFNLAVLRAQADATEEAIDLYRRTIAADPQHAAAHLNLGFLLQKIDPASPEAQAEFARAVELDPSLANRVPAPTTTIAP